MKAQNKFFDRKMVAGLFAVMTLSTLLTLLEPHDILDKKFYYTAEQAQSLLLSLSPAQSASYFYKELVDLLFIFAYSSVFFMALAKRMPKFIWLAFPAGLFDFSETSLILYALKYSPVGLDFLGYITALKWIFVVAAKITILCGLLKAKQARRRAQNSMS